VTLCPFEAATLSLVKNLALKEGFGLAVCGVHEDDVLWIAAGRVDREDDERFAEDLRGAVNGASLEEDKLAGADFEGWCVAQEELCAAGEDEKILVAGGVVVCGRWGVDAKDACAGGGFIGQASIDQHGVGCGGKVSGDGVEVEDGGRWGRFLIGVVCHS